MTLGMSPRYEAYLLFFISLAAMLSVGIVLQGWDPHAGILGTELLCVLLPALAYRWTRRDESTIEWPTFRRLGMRPRWLLWVGLTAMLVGVGANVLTGIIVELYPALKPVAEAYEQSVLQLMYPGDPLRRAAGIFAIVVMAPLCEETLFRGTILGAQSAGRRRGFGILIINGLLFSLLHVNPLTFIALVVVGTFFAHLVSLTRSVWPAIVAHAVLNGVNGVVAPYLLADSIEAGVEPTLGELAAAGAVLFPLIAALWFFGARTLARELSTDG